MRSCIDHQRPTPAAVPSPFAATTEMMEVAELGAAGFTLRTRCTTEGVPFSSNFANHVQWVATQAGPHACRLQITGALLPGRAVVAQ